MDDTITVTVSKKKLVKGFLLGLPASVLWLIGASGALSLLAGLSNGTVTPGVESPADGLRMMWSFVILCAIVGTILGIGSLTRKIPTWVLTCNLGLAFFSLFFSVLAD